MLEKTLLNITEDSETTNQTGGIYINNIQNDDSKFEYNANKQTLKHNCCENGTTINSVLNQNAELSCVKSFPSVESGGTFYNMETNGNSKTCHNIKGGKVYAKKKVSRRQSNDNSIQQSNVFETEYNTTSGNVIDIEGNKKNEFSLNNCQFNGNFLAEKVSNFEIQNSSINGVLHAIDCDKIESKNSSHIGRNNETPLMLQNTSVCNINSSKVESLCSKPHIQTITDDGKSNSTLNCKSVNFVDCPTTGEFDSAACIEKRGKGETICKISSCTSKRSEFLSTDSKENTDSVKTIFSRNNDFEDTGLDPTVAGRVIETSNSLLSQDGALISTPEDNCSKIDNQGIVIIPMNNNTNPLLTLYYCLELPAYQNKYFVSSAISFMNLIDSYQSKEKAKGIFNATSTRCMTDQNCSPIDGIYITIQGFRTPNDRNALQKDRDGNIIDRNLKESLYLEKYHITKIDPITKQTVADIGGILQYTDGNGGGSTTCVPRLIFPIHYASGEWKNLRDGYIEWNYDNRKETNYRRELRFFLAN